MRWLMGSLLALACSPALAQNQPGPTNSTGIIGRDSGTGQPCYIGTISTCGIPQSGPTSITGSITANPDVPNAGTITSSTAASTYSLVLNNQPTVAVLITGTWTGPLAVHGSVNGGGTVISLNAYLVGANTPTTSITANGTYVINTTGMNYFELVDGAGGSESGTVNITTIQTNEGGTPPFTATTPTALASAMTGTGNVQLIPAPGSGLRNIVWEMGCLNTLASTVPTVVDVQDGAGGTVIKYLSGGFLGHERSGPMPFRQPTANVGLYVKDETTAANVLCWAEYTVGR